MEREGPVIVFMGDDIKARLAQSRLEGYGIHARLIDESTNAMVLPHGAAPVKVVVAPGDVDAAREILAKPLASDS